VLYDYTMPLPQTLLWLLDFDASSVMNERFLIIIIINVYKEQPNNEVGGYGVIMGGPDCTGLFISSHIRGQKVVKTSFYALF
jgi:hypothetical protein